MLESCRGAADRAQRCLAILLDHSQASEGFLYTLGDDGPELVARIGTIDVPATLLGSVRELIEAEQRDQDQSTAALPAEPIESASVPLTTSELTGAHGERYRLVLLGHQVSGAFAITGVAAAVAKPGKPFVYPSSVAAELSRIILESGDAVPALIGR
jgi:hypothetical protein